jgi:hypothetical protein
MWRSVMIFLHFARSFSSIAANCCGVPPTGSMPRRAQPVLDVGLLQRLVERRVHALHQLGAAGPWDRRRRTR